MNKKNLKKIVISMGLIFSISSLSASAMQSINSNQQINPIFNNNKIIQQRIQRFDAIVRYTMGNEFIYDYNNPTNYMPATSDKENVSLLLTPQFVSQQLIEKNYDEKLLLIQALESKDITSVKNIAKEFLKVLLDTTVYNFLNYYDEETEKIQILEGQLDSGEIGDFFENLEGCFDIILDGNTGKYKISSKVTKYTLNFKNYDKDPKNIVYTKLNHIYAIFCIYMQKLIDEYINR